MIPSSLLVERGFVDAAVKCVVAVIRCPHVAATAVVTLATLCCCCHWFQPRGVATALDVVAGIVA